jgi:hypothetical protein
MIYFCVNGNGIERPVAEQIRDRFDGLATPEQPGCKCVPK